MSSVYFGGHQILHLDADSLQKDRLIKIYNCLLTRSGQKGKEGERESDLHNFLKARMQS